MDESGLFYRMGPRKSYLAPTESSQTVRGTDFQRQRARVSIVLYVNGDGLHNLPVRYIGHGTYQRCFLDRFSVLKSAYSLKSNLWMDSNQLEQSITWWYGEVRRLKNDDVLLIIDNFGEHERAVNLPGPRI